MAACLWCTSQFTPRQRTQRCCSKRCAGLYRYRDQPRRQHTWARSKRPPLDNQQRPLRAELLPAAMGRPCPMGCGRIMDSTAQLDHIVPRARGGPTIRSNVRIICAPCNHKLGSSFGGKVALAKRHRRGAYPTPHLGTMPRRQARPSRNW